MIKTYNKKGKLVAVKLTKQEQRELARENLKLLKTQST